MRFMHRLEAALSCLRGHPTVFGITGTLHFTDEQMEVTHARGMLSILSCPYPTLQAPLGMPVEVEDFGVWLIPGDGKHLGYDENGVWGEIESD